MVGEPEWLLLNPMIYGLIEAGYQTFWLLQIPTDLSVLIQHEVCSPYRCLRLAGEKTFEWATQCTPKRSVSMPFPTTVLSRCTTATAWGGTSCGAIGRYSRVWEEWVGKTKLFYVDIFKTAICFIYIEPNAKNYANKWWIDALINSFCEKKVRLS